MPPANGGSRHAAEDGDENRAAARLEGWGGAWLTNPRRASAAATPTIRANAICERISSDVVPHGLRLLSLMLTIDGVGSVSAWCVPAGT